MGSDDIGKAVKDARIAAAFSFTCVVLIGLLFMVDGRRNKWIADRVDEIRALISEFRVVAVSAYAGQPAEPAASVVGGGPADGGGAGGDGAAGVVADAQPGAGMDSPGAQAARAANGQFTRRAGMAGGPRGDG